MLATCSRILDELFRGGSRRDQFANMAISKEGFLLHAVIAPPSGGVGSQPRHAGTLVSHRVLSFTYPTKPISVSFSVPWSSKRKRVFEKKLGARLGAMGRRRGGPHYKPLPGLLATTPRATRLPVLGKPAA
jgi:hypothetical protein